MPDREKQRGARLWPLALLLLLPSLFALFDAGRCSRPGSERAARRGGTAPPSDAPASDNGAKDRPAPARPPSPAPSRPIAPAKPPSAAPAADEPAHTARTDTCGGFTPYGTCRGDVATACIGGRIIRADCAERGQRCVMTREGAQCLPRGGALDCSHEDVARCDGEVLRQCVDGSWETIDCAMRHARCDASGEAARCVPALTAAESFGGAFILPPPLETCDGHDDDLDGEIDEGTVCDPIALVAFVARGAVLRDFEARLARELEVVNRVFDPLVFKWDRIVNEPAAQALFRSEAIHELAGPLSRAHLRAAPKLSEAAPDLLATPVSSAARTSAEPEPELDFYIPVLFVERIATEPPKVGLSTLPNSRCGGVRLSDRPAPPHGLIVLSEERTPETLAHEIGHYLGLCHTHEQVSPFGVAMHDAACDHTGDGICDTPFDPGPPHCAELDTCAPLCEDGSAQPDTSNVMSYYMRCRNALTREQLAEVQRNLTLRRGWTRCLDPAQCPCLPGDPGACPAEMSCVPTAGANGAGVCRLDGPALPGAPCKLANDCSGGAVCLSGARGAAHCARACRETTAQCTCVDAGLPFRVCREDLR